MSGGIREGSLDDLDGEDDDDDGDEGEDLELAGREGSKWHMHSNRLPAWSNDVQVQPVSSSR
jgi:hypothetical protein